MYTIAFGLYFFSNSFLRVKWNQYESVCIICYWISFALTFTKMPFDVFAAVAASQTIKVLTFSKGTQVNETFIFIFIFIFIQIF